MKPSLQYMFCFALLPNWVINFYNQGFKQFVNSGASFLEDIFDKQLDSFLASNPDYTKTELAPCPVSESSKLFEFGFFPNEDEEMPFFLTDTPYKKGSLERIIWIFLPVDNSTEERIPTPNLIMVGVAMYSDHARFFTLCEDDVNSFTIHELKYNVGDPIPIIIDHGVTKVESFPDKVFILSCNDETRKFNVL